MRLTREEALKRVWDECKWHSSSNAKMAESIAELLLSVQAETERRVVAECCEICDIHESSAELVGNTQAVDAVQRCGQQIRDAFPE